MPLAHFVWLHLSFVSGVHALLKVESHALVSRHRGALFRKGALAGMSWEFTETGLDQPLQTWPQGSGLLWFIVARTTLGSAMFSQWPLHFPVYVCWWLGSFCSQVRSEDLLLSSTFSVTCWKRMDLLPLACLSTSACLLNLLRIPYPLVCYKDDQWGLDFAVSLFCLHMEP